jgi:hypothetical protein
VIKYVSNLLTLNGENMENILKQLSDIKKELEKPFPYRDMDKIQEDFRTEFCNLSVEEDCLTGDFNTYCMNIAGTLSYILAGKLNEIPQGQIEMIHLSFFDLFKKYTFFEDKIGNFNDFSQDYKNYEETRELLLQLLCK